MRPWLLLASLLTLLSLAPSARPASAHELCFAGKTEYCLADPFSDYWEANGGLAVFGYPISAAAEAVNPDTGALHLSQWLERQRFEDHPANAGTPYRVLLGLIGKERLAQLGRDWAAEPREVSQPGCRWFAQTGRNVCNQQPAPCRPGANGDEVCTAGVGFLNTWESNGLKIPGLDAYARSLQLFGLPLTSARLETNSSGDTVITQWFERARFEWHPDNPGQLKVLLGRLGSEISAAPASDLLQARERWASHGSRSYDFELSINCFCPPEYTEPVIVAVRAGVPVAVTSAASGRPVDPDRRSWYERVDTVDELFALIEDAIARDAARLAVSYDQTHGYPTEISIDYDFRIADEELGLQVGALRLVP
ncbi:MAG: hypothetical protein H0T53_01330 [Herpetosiphonaceae bacterium]|nr:hypothetical protein [Herpetosiphonaceae bacterium]